MLDKENIKPVPVYIAPIVARRYEAIGDVQFHCKRDDREKKPLYELGIAGAKMGADAVMELQAAFYRRAHYFGTAIKFID